MSARGGRSRIPVRDRRRPDGRESHTLCVSTCLTPTDVEDLDRVAALVGEHRSEFIRRAVADRIAVIARNQQLMTRVK